MIHGHAKRIALCLAAALACGMSLGAKAPTAHDVVVSECPDLIKFCETHGDGTASTANGATQVMELEQIADAVLSDLSNVRAANTAAVQSTIATIGPAKKKPVIEPTGYRKLLEKYAGKTPPHDGTQKGSLAPLWSDARQKLQEHIFNICEQMLVIDKVKPDGTVALGLVLPFAYVDDERWGDANTKELPEWLRDAGDLARAAEDAALRAGRPLTGYKLSHGGEGRLTDVQPATVIEYMRNSADHMFRANEIAAGLACLRCSQSLAETKGLPAQSNDVALQITEALGNSGQPKEAAEDARKLLAQQDVSEAVYQRAVLLRLKNLYASEQFGEALGEAKRYSTDSKCDACLPQVLYIGWVASRRTGTEKGEAEWREAFLNKFPKHPLGADMYFAEAMRHLAASEYAEADKLLAFIQYRYPDSSVAPRAKEMSTRLQAAKSKSP